MMQNNTAQKAGSNLMAAMLNRVTQEANWNDHTANYDAIAQELVANLELTEVLMTSIGQLEPTEEISAEARTLHEGVKGTIDQLVDELTLIAEKHKGRAGAVVEEDIALYMEIGTHYVDLHSRISSTIPPINLQLTGLQSELGAAMIARAQAAEDQKKAEADKVEEQPQ